MLVEVICFVVELWCVWHGSRCDMLKTAAPVGCTFAAMTYAHCILIWHTEQFKLFDIDETRARPR